jgi:TRAP-type C4-dicarboxylate transport system permease large subunit
VPLLVPIAEGLNINLIHFGIVVVLNMMVGLTLPPHGLLLFVMSGLTRTPLAEIFREMPPFILAMLAIVVAVTLVPEIALSLPREAGLLN